MTAPSAAPMSTMPLSSRLRRTALTPPDREWTAHCAPRPPRRYVCNERASGFCRSRLGALGTVARPRHGCRSGGSRSAQRCRLRRRRRRRSTARVLPRWRQLTPTARLHARHAIFLPARPRPRLDCGRRCQVARIVDGSAASPQPPPAVPDRHRLLGCARGRWTPSEQVGSVPNPLAERPADRRRMACTAGAVGSAGRPPRLAERVRVNANDCRPTQPTASRSRDRARPRVRAPRLVRCQAPVRSGRVAAGAPPAGPPVGARRPAAR